MEGRLRPGLGRFEGVGDAAGSLAHPLPIGQPRGGAVRAERDRGEHGRGRGRRVKEGGGARVRSEGIGALEERPAPGPEGVAPGPEGIGA